MKLNQNGIIDIAFVAVLLLLLAAGAFTVWKINQTDEAVSKTEVNTVDSVTAVMYSQGRDDQKMAEPNSAEGWVEYENVELGISFSYPKEWGDVVREKFDSNGNSDYYEFSNVENYFGIGGLQNDYTTQARGGSLMDYGGFNVDGDTFTFRSRQDKSDIENYSTDGYKFNDNKTCVYSTELFFFEQLAYHAVCNLNSETTYGYNFGTYSYETPPVELEDFVNVINSVEII